MVDRIEQAALELLRARCCVALTGAGISIESGIPPFRGPGGLWEKLDPEVAHIDTFRRDPAQVWRLLIRGMQDVLQEARPNPAHVGLARLEAWGVLRGIITQNVDGLHQKAGSRVVVEFHGSFAWQRCTACQRRSPTEALDLTRCALPPRCGCGGILRPDCVFFGERIPPAALESAHRMATECDLMLVVGTSATVQPAAMVPLRAKEAGARVIEINPDPTPLTHQVSDLLIRGKAGTVIAALVEAVTRLRQAPEH
jgi:NAD-dependent deacetylase